MNFLKKSIGITLMVIISIMTISCNKEDNMKNQTLTLDKSFNRVDLYKKNVPQDYQLIDWKERAQNYDNLVYDYQASGAYLPVIWNDQTYNTFGIPAYVGDPRMNQDGEEEAVTTIASVLSASLIGIDKSNQNGIDFVSQLNAFFSQSEGVVLNNPAGSSETTSMWYMLYPAIMYTQISSLYPNEQVLKQNVLTNIESWYKAYEVMYNNGNPDFDYTGFNFKTNLPYRNGIWKEPDSAVGIALLMYDGYELTGDNKYLEASIHSMDYIEQYFGSPQYEVLMYYAPALMAELNALHGTHYDVQKALNHVFDGASIPRGGWGSIVGQWGDYDMNGLFGSTTDGGGYAFSMNTFASTGAIAPLVQYDARFAKSIGEWILNVSSNARYFFADETILDNQSCTHVDTCTDVSDAVKEAIPYEGIRNGSNGKTPWFGGDPTAHGWALTDFSLYSGAHTGVLASLIEKTNVDEILKVDLQATQAFKTSNYPTYLLYNPYSEIKTINYQIKSNETVDLYNTLTNTFVAQNVSENTNIDIPANDAIVIVEIPSGSNIVHSNHNFYIDNNFISADVVTLNIDGYKDKQVVSGKITLNLSLVGNVNDEIDNINVQIDGKNLSFHDINQISLNTNDFSSGLKKIAISITTKNGLTDNNFIILQFK